MRIIIYYFTGTGNSLKAAKEISENIGKCELLPMVSFSNQSTIIPKVERVGFIFPLYWYGLPGIVQKFINKIDFSETSYLFSVTTAMYTDGLAIQQIEALLEKKGNKLNSGFYIQMPTNYILSFNLQSEKKQSDIIKKSENKMITISKTICSNTNKKDKETFLYRTVTNAKYSYSKWMESFSSNDSKFWVQEELCNTCKICEKVCPANNIEIVEGLPVWNHKCCEQCLACIHSCPRNAIQNGETTLKRGRYRNPQISIKELIDQNSRQV